MNRLIAVFGMCLMLVACGTSQYTAGPDFPSASVPNIDEGKIPTTKLRALFGEPYTKWAVSETDEKLVYTYKNGYAHAQS
ncbi:hypothetical protein O999_23070 [Pseudomonas putida LF54]|nr:hypothetical protein O999_23070 [Pseudomonas putida LF54]